MNDLTELRDRLEELADTYRPRPESIAVARARGRRSLRMRRCAAAVGSAAAIAVVATAAAGGLPGLGAHAGTRGSLAGSKAPGAAASQHATGADPLLRTASFGWLPAGLSTDGYVTDSQNQPYLELDAAGHAASLILTAYWRGGMPPIPDLPGGVPGSRIPAAPIDGRPAYWVIQPTLGPQAQENFEMQWEYAPGRWADLQAASLHAASVSALTWEARRIAASASFGRPSLVAMPFAVTGIPAGLVARRAVLNTGPGANGLIFFSGPGNSPADSLQIGVWPASAGIQARKYDRRRDGGSQQVTPNTTIDGYRAYDSQLSRPATASAVLYVLDVHGFVVQIDASGPALQALPGGLAGLFRAMTVVSGSDQAAWTVFPVRR
jgi:hypothetical protein